MQGMPCVGSVAAKMLVGGTAAWDFWQSPFHCAGALDEVQTTPPAGAESLIAAVEFM